MKKKMMALALCLALPFGALAVEAGVVEEATPVDMQAVMPAADVSYLPDESYYAGSTWEPDWEHAEEWVENEFGGEYYCDVSQNPFLTAGEQKRAKKLLEDYKAGRAACTGESVLDKMEDVIVGVYALDPGDYDGERAFVILPGTCLTDEQLLSIIAAFDELGLEFDPEGLDYRNCMRGGGIETTRFFVEEERARYTDMAEWIKLGRLVPPEGLEGLVRNPQLDRRCFCGMGDFSIKPYRPMTDEELLSLLLAIGVHDERGEIDHAAVESRARALLYDVLGCPLSMESTGLYNGGSYVPNQFTAEGGMGWDYAAEARESYGVTFTYHTQEGILVYASVSFDRETDEAVSIDTMHDSGPQPDIPRDPVFGATQEKIDAAVAGVESRLGLTDLAWKVVMDDTVSTNWGLCIPVRAMLDESHIFTIYIGYEDGCERGMALTQGTLVDELLPFDREDEGNG